MTAARKTRGADERSVAPLYPDEAQLAELVLGPGRAAEWAAKAVILERRGLPPVNSFFGGRFYPAVVAFFRIEEGLDDHATSSPTMRGGRGGIRVVPLAPDGHEDFDAEKEGAARHRRLDRRLRRARA